MLNLETLVFDLPEDVLKRKWAGDFEGELQLIDALLEKDIPEILAIYAPYVETTTFSFEYTSERAEYRYDIADSTDAGGSHHGFTAAHIALTQAVHRSA